MILDNWDSRVFDIVDLLTEFGKETDVSYYTGTATQREKAINDIWRLYLDPDTDIILVYESDVLAGLAIVYYDTLLTDGHGIGIVGKFYVAKEYRGTGVGRKLCQLVNDWFDKKGAVDSFVTSTAGIGENKQFENLFKKFGYTPVGVAMRRTKT